MRRVQIHDGPERHDPARVNLGVRHVIMALDMIEIHRLSDSAMLVQVHEVALHTSIIDNAADVTFEMAVINRVKADERAEKPPVCFHDAVAKEISIGGES